MIKKILSYIIENKHYYILSIIYRLFIIEKLPNGKNKIIHSRASSRITILALDSDRYRGDLEALATNSSFRVLFIRQKWQGAIVNLLRKNLEIGVKEYINTHSDDVVAYDNILSSQKFMREFLEILFSMIKVNCVTNVNHRYIEDAYWTLASEQIEIPYIMLYRECLLQKESRFYHDVVQRFKSTKFHGSHIIVHNNTCKETFIESLFCKEDDISVIGALRMDKYLKDINSDSYCINNGKKRFTMFYFPYDMSLFGKSGTAPSDYKYKYAFSVWPDRKFFFKEVHSAIVELSIEYPDIDFVIKPKNIMMKGKAWKFYESVLNEIDFDINKSNNYSVCPNANVHNLIKSSNVICALQSTTVIESAISGKPIILPVFESYRATENFQDFGWKKHMELFDIANNKQHFKDLIIDLMDISCVSDSVLNKRKKVFKSFFNDLDGVSLDGYVNTITSIVESKNNSIVI